MATNNDTAAAISASKEAFLQEMDRLKLLEAMDRAALGAAFERQARMLVEAQLRPAVEQFIRELRPSRTGSGTPPPAPPPSPGGGGEDGTPRRLDRLENKVDKMDETVGEIAVALGRIEQRLEQCADTTAVARVEGEIGKLVERLLHVPMRAEMYLAAGVALAALLGVMAKGFGWL